VLEEAGAQPPEFFAAEITSQLPRFGLSLGEMEISRLARYLAELDLWRRRTNLTGPLSGEDLVSHGLESAFGANLIAHGARVLDIGSGAGLPGIPLAIALPALAMTLLEPRALRAAFLRHAVETVPVKNAEVVEQRVEKLSGETYEVATTRALGNIPRLIRGAEFLVPGGALLSWTTEPQALAQSLNKAFSLEAVQPIPESSRRVLALFRLRRPLDAAGWSKRR
jgi:16S rRNA (guanine527-N7)-methyltransferase